MNELLILIFMYMYLFKVNLILNSNLLFLIIFFMMMKLNWMDLSFIMMNLSLSFYSFNLLILTLWIFSLVIMNLNKENKLCLFINFTMMMFMFLFFISLNYLFFYLMFEASLLMIFLLMMNWGYSMNRILASFYLMFYTLFFSLPLLFIILYLYMKNNNLNFKLMELTNNYISMFMFIYMLLSFLVKIPMYLMHSWLLKAHVEAPFYGSMILASIMLKLGSYGMLRLMFIFKYFFLKMNNYILMISILGMLILSIMCLRQLDMKLIVAMSSIIHMGLMLMGMMTFTKLGINGSYLMMISHGLSSSGLFYLIEMIYKQTNSRLLMINKGLINLMPSMSLMWFMLCSSNSSAPFSMNLVSEIFLLMSLIYKYKILLLLLFLYCLLSFIYSIYLFSFINHGNYYFKFNLFNGKLINYFTLMMHWIPLNIFVFNLILI